MLLHDGQEEKSASVSFLEYPIIVVSCRDSFAMDGYSMDLTRASESR
jgi:hypothetical protein